MSLAWIKGPADPAARVSVRTEY